MTTIATDPATLFTEQHVTADGFDIRYYEAGAGDPVVVLHGAGGPSLSPALALLAQHFRVIPFVLPGWGADANDRTQTLDEMAETVAAATAAIGLERYHVIGTSFGGAVALHLAMLHPDTLISMVLEGPAQFRIGASSPDQLPPERLIAALRAHPEREPVLQPPDPAYQAQTWPVVERLLASTPEYDEDVAARMTECMVRTLVLFGTKDGLIAPQNAPIYRRLLPNCSMEYVYDAAHAIQEDRAEAFADVVGDFLQRGMLYLIPDQDTLINP